MTYMKMQRVYFLLPVRQQVELELEAGFLGISKAELLRRWVDAGLRRARYERMKDVERYEAMKKSTEGAQPLQLPQNCLQDEEANR